MTSDKPANKRSCRFCYVKKWIVPKTVHNTLSYITYSREVGIIVSTKDLERTIGMIDMIDMIGTIGSTDRYRTVYTGLALRGKGRSDMV